MVISNLPKMLRNIFAAEYAPQIIRNERLPKGLLQVVRSERLPKECCKLFVAKGYAFRQLDL